MLGAGRQYEDPTVQMMLKGSLPPGVLGHQHHSPTNCSCVSSMEQQFMKRATLVADESFGLVSAYTCGDDDYRWRCDAIF